MTTLDWLNEYDIELYSQVIQIMGDQPSPYYDENLLSNFNDIGVTGFYFNYLDVGDNHAVDWLPENHRLATIIVRGVTTRASAAYSTKLYKAALDSVRSGGKMHTILYFKDNRVELQSLLSLGNLNKHPAMGTQVIVGSPTTGFLKAVTDFVSRFADRDDIFQLDSGTWNDGFETIQTHVKSHYVRQS